MLLASKDLVSVDSFAARLYGFDPQKIEVHYACSGIWAGKCEQCISRDDIAMAKSIISISRSLMRFLTAFSFWSAFDDVLRLTERNFFQNCVRASIQ